MQIQRLTKWNPSPLNVATESLAGKNERNFI